MKPPEFYKFSPKTLRPCVKKSFMFCLREQRAHYRQNHRPPADPTAAWRTGFSWVSTEATDSCPILHRTFGPKINATFQFSPRKLAETATSQKKGRRSSPDLAGTTMRLVWSNNFFKQLNQFSQLSSHPSLQEDRDFFATYVEPVPPLFGDIQEESVERSG